MSRLNYLAAHEEAILSLQEDISVLERYRDAGNELTHDEQAQLRLLLPRLVRLMNRVDWTSDSEPLPEWLQRRNARGSANLKRRASG